MSAFATQHRLRSGRLHRVHFGVYAVGHRAISLHGRWMAGVLACGPGAVLSHRDAAALWGIRPNSRSLTDITAIGRGYRQRPGIALYVTGQLHPDDHTVVEGIPVTSVAKTLLDLAAVMRRPHDLDRAVEAAERLQLFDLRSTRALIDRSRGRRGVQALRTALASYEDLPHLTRSGLERRFLRMCRRAALPMPATNTWVAGQEVDVVWHAHRLAVELDSHSTHGSRAAFERDRLRDAALQMAGYRVLRITDRRLRDAPAATIATVRALLS